MKAKTVGKSVDSDATGRAGIHAVGGLVEGQLRWAFREQPTNDYGIDAQVETKTDNDPTGRLLALQIKSGPSYFKEQTKQGVVYRGTRRHLDYWQRYSLPVILALHEPSTNRTFWELVSKDTVKLTPKGWKIVVPFTNVLDARCAPSWLAISEGSPYQRRLRAMVLAKPWMNLILEDKRLILTVEEWVNKSSGRGAMQLLVKDPETEDEEVVEDWPTIMLPGAIYQDVIPHLFPWADVAIDDEFYESYDEAAHDAECAIYSEGDFMCHTEDYRDWRKRRARFRPYEMTGGGEVACFRLELTISPLGQSFLHLDDYLEKGVVPLTPAQVEMDGHYATGLKAITQRLGLGGAQTPEGVEPAEDDNDLE